MKSCVYEGTVQHQRLSPARIDFRYSLYMMYLDLDELPHLFRDRWFWSSNRFNLAWFRREDHFGDPQVPLAEAVRDLVAKQTGRRPDGPICLLTHLRYFGYCFNPVSFYFCFGRENGHVEAVVAEVHNTPWGEEHCYVLSRQQDESSGSPMRFRFRKAFHVSPFMDMDVGYDWRLSEPGPRLVIHMENLKDDHKFFEATLVMSRQAITGHSLARVLIRYPLMTSKIIGAIYYQALRLWLHRCPFYTHPKKLSQAVTKDSPP